MWGISGDFHIIDQLLVRYYLVVRYLRKRGIQHDNISVIKEACDSVNGGSSESTVMAFGSPMKIVTLFTHSMVQSPS